MIVTTESTNSNWETQETYSLTAAVLAKCRSYTCSQPQLSLKDVLSTKYEEKQFTTVEQNSTKRAFFIGKTLREYASDIKRQTFISLDGSGFVVSGVLRVHAL